MYAWPAITFCWNEMRFSINSIRIFHIYRGKCWETLFTQRSKKRWEEFCFNTKTQFLKPFQTAGFVGTAASELLKARTFLVTPDLSLYLHPTHRALLHLLRRDHNQTVSGICPDHIPQPVFPQIVLCSHCFIWRESEGGWVPEPMLTVTLGLLSSSLCFKNKIT